MVDHADSAEPERPRERSDHNLSEAASAFRAFALTLNDLWDSAPHSPEEAKRRFLFAAKIWNTGSRDAVAGGGKALDAFYERAAQRHSPEVAEGMRALLAHFIEVRKEGYGGFREEVEIVGLDVRGGTWTIDFHVFPAEQRRESA